MKKLLFATLFVGLSAFACGNCNSCCSGHFVDGVEYSEDACPSIHCLPDAEVIEVVTPPPPPAPCGCASQRVTYRTISADELAMIPDATIVEEIEGPAPCSCCN